VVIIGNGNVALDVARILLLGPDELRVSDIAEHARQALASSKVREVVIVGRRGPLQAAYSVGEFYALATLPGVDVVIDADDAALDSASETYLAGPDATYEDDLRAELGAKFAATETNDAERRVVFRYLADATEVLGTTQAEGVQFRRNEMVEEDGRVVARASDAEPIVEEAGLVLTAIGYRGRAIPGIPFDEARGAIPHSEGRVLDDGGDPAPGLYSVGWAKRGARGGIGAGRGDAQETAACIVADFNDGALVASGPELAEVLASNGIDVVTVDGWNAIDAHERAAGEASGRPRQKLVHIDEMLQVATAGSSPKVSSRTSP
jgi:ferredoxin--NADP+ reductase